MWSVFFHADFEPEFDGMSEVVQDALLARAELLRPEGPHLGRPFVDTLKGSKHRNMKELRFEANGAWRIAFAFDPARQAIILAAGDKASVNQRRFYRKLIETADRRFTQYLNSLGGRR